MELDKRIKNITDIQSVTNGCNDWMFMTKKGYFANSIFNFKELKRLCVYGEYAGWREHNQCFLCEQAGDSTYYSYFLPEDSLLPKEPEKKYRAFTLNEFLERYKMGNTVTFRLKKGEYVPEAESLVEYQRMITGYESLPEDRDKPGKGSILLGGCPPISLARLFEFYELDNDFNWQPFGIIDEDKE